MAIKADKIGLFDSGFGGLDILRSITKELPDYSYIYLADTARAPYGERSQELIYKFTEQAVDFLFKQDCFLVVLACNTASSEALRKIQQEYLAKNYSEGRVLGVIIPSAEEAVELTKNNRVGVIATRGTALSGAFAREIKKLKPQAIVFEEACPLLVGLVESGQDKSEIADMALKQYLKPLLKQNIDTLILGCTHYGFLIDKISKIVGPEIKIVCQGNIIGQKLKEYLKNHPEIERELLKKSNSKFYTTDLTDHFQELGQRFLGASFQADKIVID